jgi:hypothetical protein
MHEPVCMLIQQLLAAAAACMRARVVARVIDTMYQLIYSSAQTRAWRIEFSYRKYLRILGAVKWTNSGGCPPNLSF